MKKSRSLRKQINILLACVVCFQTITIICVLLFSNVFKMLDYEEMRTFSNITESKAEVVEKKLNNFMSFMETQNSELSIILNEFAIENNTTVKEIYQDQVLYEEMMTLVSDQLIYVLDKMDITGAFVILDDSETNIDVYPTVYYRDLMPEKQGKEDIQMMVGPISIAQSMQIPTASTWQVDLKDIKLNNQSFYTNPINAAKDYPNSESLRYGYWAQPFDILGDGTKVLVYTLPLIDENGEAYGVIGAGINLKYLSEELIASTEMYYENSFYMASDYSENSLNKNWAVPSNSFGFANIVSGEEISLSETNAENIYSFKLDTVGKMSTYVRPIKMYSENSPFKDETLAISGVVETSSLNSNSNVVGQRLIFSIIITTIISILALLIFAYISTRKIKDLANYVEELSPLDEIYFEPTGILEIDELTEAVQSFNKSLIEANQTTSRILELSLLPLGAFEIIESSPNVKLTDFLYNLLHIESGTIVNKKEWKSHYAKLTSQTHSEYENVYYYFDEIANKEHWLRIKTTKTESGTIGAVSDVTVDIKENERLIRQLDYDALTGLLCQTTFRKNVAKAIRRNRFRVGAMVFIDLDNLKYINDNFGHEIGDKLIVDASKIFSDFEKYNALVSRFSGDEFAVFFYGYESKEELSKVIDLIRLESDKHYVNLPNGTSNKIRFSGGISWYPEDAEEVNSLLRLADFAMLEAKKREKGSLYQFDKKIYSSMSYLLENSEAINRLIDERLIRFAFQPIVDVKTGEIYAYEALMRPLTPEFGGPLEVLSVAEAQSKLPQLDKLILSIVFETIEQNKEIIGDKLIFINSIPNDAADDDYIINFKEKYSEFFDQIVIEIIERESRDETVMLDKINNLKNSGLKVAIDDFGSGYSNEVRILKILPNILKIDMELVQGIAKDVDKQVIVNSIIEFCHQKNIKFVAEGVEEQEDLFYFIDKGADFVQGYYLAKPNFEFLEIPLDKKKEIVEYNAKRNLF